MSTLTSQQADILVAGQWRPSVASTTFQSFNPATGEPLPYQFPVSTWADCEQALQAAVDAAEHLRRLPPAQIAAFLEAFAVQLEANGGALCELAHCESALPVKPRLADVELPRTAGQLRQAAVAARSGSWAQAVIDTKHSVRYLRLPRLGDELSALQALARTSHWLKTLSRIDLLILDDFGLVSMCESHPPLLLELLEDRHQRGSVLVTSQLPIKLWHGQFKRPDPRRRHPRPTGAQRRVG